MMIHKVAKESGLVCHILAPRNEDLQYVNFLIKKLIKRNEKAVFPSLINFNTVTNKTFFSIRCMTTEEKHQYDYLMNFVNQSSYELEIQIRENITYGRKRYKALQDESDSLECNRFQQINKKIKEQAQLIHIPNKCVKC